jgi:hypothetical protein
MRFILFLTEFGFREKYKVYWRLPVLGIPIVALSGSVPMFVLPRFVLKLGLCVERQMGDMKLIDGGDVFGTFPQGFQIKFAITSKYLSHCATFAYRRVRDGIGAVHIFVANTDDGDRLLRSLQSKAVNCKFVCGDTTPEDLKTAATKWSNGDLDVLISTSIALVGNENPSCRYLVCARYFFDALQVVQAFGRLRKYMRSSTGQVCFAAPESLPDHRIKDDQHRYTRLFNGKLISEEDNALFKATMTSGGVREWMIDAASGTKACPLKKLSHSFGRNMDNCTAACLFCRTITINNVQVEANRRIESERRNEQATERVLGKLALCCLACTKSNCRGIPFFCGKDIKQHPLNRHICFKMNMCFQCGVSAHNRTQCFDKSFLNNIACCECWVFKGVPGSMHHETTDCAVKGRLRRLLSDHFLRFKIVGTFKDYLEGIYSSSHTFCEFMSSIEVKYMKKK